MNHVSMYLLTGISFAGKSVLAQALSQARGWKVIDPDAVAHEHGQGLHGEFLSDEQWAGIHQEAEQRAGALLRAGESIIYDTTAVTRAERNALRQLAFACGAYPILIYVKIDREEALRRWEANKQTRERFLVHLDDFNMVADHFQPPAPDEAPLIYRSGEDISAWIQANIPPL